MCRFFTGTPVRRAARMAETDAQHQHRRRQRQRTAKGQRHGRLRVQEPRIGAAHHTVSAQQG